LSETSIEHASTFNQHMALTDEYRLGIAPKVCTAHNMLPVLYSKISGTVAIIAGETVLELTLFYPAADRRRLFSVGNGAVHTRRDYLPYNMSGGIVLNPAGLDFSRNRP
jgi:hypothetical protein